MNKLSIAARAAGLVAAMEPADPREVPEEFRAVADAWLEAYDSISTAMRSGFGAAVTMTDNRSRRSEAAQ